MQTLRIQDVNLLNAGITEIGMEVLATYTKGDYRIYQKSDHSPVTDADLRAHEQLNSLLEKHFSFPVISEESFEESSTQEPFPTTFWLLDPIDGTKEFIRRTGHFTVNVALIHEGKPVAGFIHAPVFRELFYAIEGQGAFILEGEGSPRQLGTRPTLESSLILLTNSKIPRFWPSLKAKWHQSSLVHVGSSLKYCRISQGEADIYVCLSPSHEWDTAAAQCILEEAGGVVLGADFQTLRYGKEGLRNGPLIALGDKSFSPHLQTFMKENLSLPG